MNPAGDNCCQFLSSTRTTVSVAALQFRRANGSLGDASLSFQSAPGQTCLPLPSTQEEGRGRQTRLWERWNSCLSARRSLQEVQPPPPSSELVGGSAGSEASILLDGVPPLIIIVLAAPVTDTSSASRCLSAPPAEE